jgi:tetratricopeptide (TPR) repeat protein
VKKVPRHGLDPASLDELIDELTAEAGGDDERILAFQQACKANIVMPCEAFVIGEPVSLIGFDYDGSQRRGLTVTCRRADGSEYVVAASEVVISPRTEGARYLGAYRKWMGLAAFPPEEAAPLRNIPRRARAAAALDLRGPVELAVLSVKQKAARCRLLGTEREITLRATGLWDVVPGEIAVVKPRKQWSYAGHPYLSGEIESVKLDVAALGLTPLRLEDRGMWDPAGHYWGEEDEPIEDWAKPIIARGPRGEFEMEQVLPGQDPEDPFSDPITESNDLKNSGDREGAYKILMDLCQADLRCLDAHAHLGNLAFDHRPEDAIRHYEVGFRIGELSLGEGFDGLLPWGWIDNRPFLRSMHCFGLCLWRLGRFEEAGRIFDRMLWLNPSDNQGVRFLIDAVRARAAWEDSEEE